MVITTMKEIEEILKNYNDNEQKLIKRAYNFAKKAHQGQKRESGADYITHPLAVAHTLAKLSLDNDTVMAALLHDVLEDSNITDEEILKEFGDNVYFLVASVTKLKDLDYVGDAELAENFRKMIFYIAQDIRVVLIKLADVLHNAKTLEFLPPEKQKRYANEIIEIYAPIASRLSIGRLKGQLEDLAFPYVYPGEYKKLTQTIRPLVLENEEYIANLKPTIAKMLSKENIVPLKIDARAKHLYSLWRKLKKYDGDLEKIYDLAALRIVVSDVSSCYTVLGTIHKHWTPLPGRIKDYIALPKPNGYRSLHTTVFCESGKITEFQIRTEDMHHEAEFGIASHWTYKENVKSPFKKKLAWIHQLKDWQKAVGSKEFLEGLKIDFFHDRIFVFTPKGDVIELPEEATPIDFAYAIHSDLGDRCQMARVNGKPTQLSSPLKNNDLVEIITAKNKKPSPDWLTFVKTSKARAKIREARRRES